MNLMQATRSEEMLARSNRAAFQAEPHFQVQPRRTTAACTCAAALLLLWIFLFVIVSRVFTQEYVRNVVIALGSILMLAFTALCLRGKCGSTSRADDARQDAPFSRRAREGNRERQLRYAQRNLNPAVIRIVR